MGFVRRIMLGALAKVYRATGRLLARPPRALTNKPQPVADTVQFALTDPSYYKAFASIYGPSYRRSQQ